MQPNYPTNRFPAKLLFISAMVLVIALIGFTVYQSRVFHIIKTDPSLSSFPATYPYLKVYFNDELSKDNLRVAIPSGLVRDYSADGKVLTFTLQSNLPLGTPYVITLKHIENTKGKTIQNRQLTFTTKDIPYDQLSKPQKDALVANQDKPKYSVYSIQFVNFQQLLDKGLSQTQQLIVENAIFTTSQIVKQQFNTVTLQPNSVIATPFDPNSDNPAYSVTFDFTANNKTYHTTVSSTNISDAQAVIKDSSGVVVYDSTTAVNT